MPTHAPEDHDHGVNGVGEIGRDEREENDGRSDDERSAAERGLPRGPSHQATAQKEDLVALPVLIHSDALRPVLLGHSALIVERLNLAKTLRQRDALRRDDGRIAGGCLIAGLLADCSAFQSAGVAVQKSECQDRGCV